MERVGILINRLQEQFSANTSNDQLAITAQMLLNELKLENNTSTFNKKVAVTMPFTAFHPTTETESTTDITNFVVEEVALSKEEYVLIENEEELLKEEEQPIVVEFDLQIESLPMATSQIDETIATVEESIPTEVEEVAPIIEETQPNTFFESAFKYDYSTENLPTMMHQKPKEVYVLNDVLVEEEPISIHTKFREERKEVATVLESAPIKDLKKAISVNDRYVFIQELFRGDEAMFERSLKTINSFSILPEAFFWMERELKIKIGWPEKSETVEKFYHLVRRRFS